MNNAPSREAAIFDAALQLPAEQRGPYLDQTCASDASLRQRVEALLKACHANEEFLNAPAAPTFVPRHLVPVTEKPGDWIGRYKLLQQIGEGGCGVVYMAEQEEPVRRRVALKVIKLGMDTKSVIARFEAERQALAMMDHPNIAKVLDAGATDTGRPYFVMELVRGIKITEYCDELKLSTRERLNLFLFVCQAVQHAHQKGIIHRDLKPSNILVTEHDGVAVPKIIDFGIAKATSDQRLTDKTLFTAFEQFIGTPAYTSPEQAGLGGLDVDTRSDIYSLGVLLYELLSGQPPFSLTEFQRSAIDEILRVIREKEPPRPSARLTTLNERELTTVAQHRQIESAKLAALLRGDLDWVVMKCLEKDRTRRYETANGLAADIQRHLNNEPVAARPPSNVYRFQKLVRRNKLAVSAAAAVTAALLLGLGISTWMFLKERQARQRAVLAEHTARVAQTNEIALRFQAEIARSNEVQLRLDAEIARTNEAILTREAQASARKASAEAARRTEVAELLAKIFEGVAPSVAMGRDTKLLQEILDRANERIRRTLTNQPAVQADLLVMLGEAYGEIGLVREGESCAREAVRLARPLGEAETLAAALNSLAGALHAQDKREEAVQCFREALQLLSPVGAHTQVAEYLTGLAWALASINQLPEAESAILRSISMRQKLKVDHDDRMAHSLHVLAGILDDQRKFAEAEEREREALAMFQEVLGKKHPDVATSLNNLGLILNHRRQYAAAATILSNALDIRLELLGSNHLKVAATFNNLGIAHGKRGHLEVAEHFYRESLRAYRVSLGDEARPVMQVRSHLAGIVSDRGDFKEAERLYLEALEPWRTQRVEKSPAVAHTLSDLAYLYREQGRLPEAEDAYRGAVEIGRTVLPPSDPQFHSTLASYASVLLAVDKPADAEPAAREYLECLEKYFPKDRMMPAAQGLLGRCFLEQKRYADAEPLLVSSYETMKAMEQARPSQDKRRFKTALESLITLHRATDRAAAATELQRELDALSADATKAKHE